MVRSRISKLTCTAVSLALLCGLALHWHDVRAQEAAQDQLQEVLVTARKQTERLIDVPASVDVVDAVTIDRERIVNVEDLFGKVPSLYFSANFLSPARDYVNLVVRGIGAQSAGVPAVGTYIDGIYAPALGFDVGFLDVERVEVLEGPQGTLFGRNTEGGALSIVTRKPTQEFRGQFQTSYDSFNTFDEKLSVSGGLSSDLSGSAAVHYAHTDGYLKAREIQEELAQTNFGKPVPNVSADDMSTINARGALRWNPADGDTDVNLALDLSNARGHEGLPGVPICCFAGGRGDSFGGDPYGVYSTFQVDGHNTNQGASLTIEHKLPFGTLTALTGYRYLTNDSPFDFSGGPGYPGNFHDIKQEQRFISQEIRLNGAVGQSFNWLAGVFGFKENDDQHRTYSLATTPIYPGIDVTRQDQLIKRTGYALFGQVNWDPIANLELTAGVRYAWERASSDLAVLYEIPNLLGPGVPYIEDGTQHGSVSFTDISPTASVRYKIGENLSLYGRYAKGYKPGGFPSAPTLGTDIPFKSERSDNYEVGVKSELFDRKLAINVAVYDIEIKDQQLSTVVILNNIPFASVGNAGKSRSRGAELNVTGRPLRGLEFSLSAGIIDAKYQSYIDTAGKDRSGERFPFVPRTTVGASIDYQRDLVNGWQAFVGTSYKYVGSIVSGTGVDLDLQFPVPSYSQLDLRAGASRDNWRFEGYVNNVTDRYIVTRIWNTFFFPDPPARPFASVAPPRLYGVRVTYKF